MEEIITPLDAIIKSIDDLRCASHVARKSNASEQTFDDILANVNLAKNGIIKHLFASLKSNEASLPLTNNKSKSFKNDELFSTVLKKTQISNKVIIPIGNSKPTQSTIDVTEQKVTNLLKSNSISATILKTTSSDKGNITVHFAKDDGLESIKKEMVREFGENVKLSTPLLPNFKVISVPNYFNTENKDEVVKNILQNNLYLNEILKNKAEKLEFLFSFNTKTGKSLIFKCSPNVRQALKLNHDTIKVDSKQCKLYNRIFIHQCSFCCKLGHTKHNCQSQKPFCTFCCQEHEFKNCQVKHDANKHCCKNCLEASDTVTKQNACTHHAFSTTCPLIIAQKERITSRTDFGENISART